MDEYPDLPPPPPKGPSVWLRGAAIGLIAFLAGSVILGMFLY